VIKGYSVPKTPPLDSTANKLYNANSRVINAILDGLGNTVFFKVMHCKSTKYFWNKLNIIY